MFAQGTGVTQPAGQWWKWVEKLPAPARFPLQLPFVRFLIVGALNTALGYSVYAVLILARVPYAAAVLLSTVVGILFNFKSYGTLIFGSHDNRLIFRFIAVYAVIYALNVLLLGWLQQRGVSLLVGGALLTVPLAGVAFLLNRRFVFPPNAK